jgi:hypothetical protein
MDGGGIQRRWKANDPIVYERIDVDDVTGEIWQ